MPSWRISESLPATPGSFDLVIFDEASQSDISALPALMRASKVLIVGDDKQVSPTAAFIEEQKIRSLRLHYLDGQPFGALMLPGNSLYELALACYPGRRIKR
jgi:superfamily I DNA and/or RNA helicase